MVKTLTTDLHAYDEYSIKAYACLHKNVLRCICAWHDARCTLQMYCCCMFLHSPVRMLCLTRTTFCTSYDVKHCDVHPLLVYVLLLVCIGAANAFTLVCEDALADCWCTTLLPCQERAIDPPSREPTCGSQGCIIISFVHLLLGRWLCCSLLMRLWRLCWCMLTRIMRMQCRAAHM
jgi:hypothetical protein